MAMKKPKVSKANQGAISKANAIGNNGGTRFQPSALNNRGKVLRSTAGRVGIDAPRGEPSKAKRSDRTPKSR